MKSMIPSLLIPDTVLLPLLVMAGLLMIIGFRKAASGIMVFVLIGAFSPMFEPIVEGLINALPWWAVFLLVVFIVLQVLRFTGELFLGPEVWGSFFGGVLRGGLRFVMPLLLLLGFYAMLH
jgi:hypothetical protein